MSDLEREYVADIKDLESTLEERDKKIVELEEKVEAQDDAIEEKNGEIEDLQKRDIHAYLEDHPEQLLDALVPADVAMELFRERVIDCNTASGLTLGEFFDLLTE